MKILNVEQGSEKWQELRLGIPTASCFDKLLTPVKLKPGKATAYLTELLAEWATGEPLDGGESLNMLRGTAGEKQARAYYELQRDVDVTQVGFITTDDGRVGCSPDGLVGDDGGVEIKVPLAKGIIDYLLEDDPSLAHRGQIQGALWITGRDWWDLCIWHPYLPSIIYRCYPDEAWQEAFGEALPAFLERLETARERLRALGCGCDDEALRREQAADPAPEPEPDEPPPEDLAPPVLDDIPESDPTAEHGLDPIQRRHIFALVSELAMTDIERHALTLEWYGTESLTRLSRNQADDMIQRLKEMANAR